MSEIIPIEVGAARRLTERIRLVAMTVGDNITKLKTLVAEAKESEVHVALGYASWTAYLSDVLGETPLMLERDVRRELVMELTEQGMSTRAIAPIVGVDQKTVVRDIAREAHASPDSNVSHTPLGSAERAETALDASFDPTPTLPPRDDDWIVADPQTGEVIEPVTITETHTVKTVMGLDGKTYPTKPATPHKAQRKALTDTAKDVGWELRKVAEKLQRIQEDDRFSRNKNEVAAHIRGHLMFTVEVCQDMLDVLNQS